MMSVISGHDIRFIDSSTSSLMHLMDLGFVLIAARKAMRGHGK